MSDKKGKTLAEVENTEVATAEIKHYGTALIVPEGMRIKVAIDLLMRKQEYEAQETSLTQIFEALPDDGAVALANVLTAIYGWAPQVATPGFWFDHPPELRTVAIGVNQTAKVPWGRFALPQVDGYIQTHQTVQNGLVHFMLEATVKRVHEPEINRIFTAVRDELRANSIYRGKALRIEFTDNDGDRLPAPKIKFFQPDRNASDLIYSRSVQDAIETNLFTPIRQFADLKANGLPFKRGILLAGTYGTGKTLAAEAAATLATQANITYFYVAKGADLPIAIDYSRLYAASGVVVFGEDIDRITDGPRDADTDTILNTIDGIDGKNSNIMVIVTTNEPDKINRAMLRPGRLDAVIEVNAPDGEAIERLLRYYGGGRIPEGEDLATVGELLAGNVPAVVAEVVKRAQLVQLRLQGGGLVTELRANALEEAARTMGSQLRMLNGAVDNDAPPTLDALFKAAVSEALGSAGYNASIHSDVKDLKRRTGAGGEK